MATIRSASATKVALMLLVCVTACLISTQSPADQIDDSVAQLASVNPYDRRAAMESLGASKNTRAIQPLMDRLGDSTDGKWAAKSLAVVGAPSVDALIKALSARLPVTRENAARALGIIKDAKATKPILALLKDKDTQVRASAAEALGFSTDSAVIDRLIVVASDKDEDYEVRYPACKALGSTGNRKAVDFLVAQLQTPDGDLFDAAVQALAYSTDIRVVRAVARTVRSELVRPTADVWPNIEHIVEPLIILLKDSDAAVRAGAAWGLASVFSRDKDAQALEPLIGAVKDIDPKVRMAVARALAVFGGEAVVEPLVGLLGDADPQVRIDAIYELQRLRNPRAIEPLCALMSDPSPDVRRILLYALADLGDARSVDPLLRALADPKSSVSREALLALGATRDSRALNPLLSALQSSDASVRAYAAGGLGRLGSKEAVEPLIGALKDQDVTVQRSAASALGQIHDQRAVLPLIELLKTSDNELRSEVEDALGYLKDSRAVKPLLGIALADPAHEVGAMMALTDVGDPSAVEPIIALLDNSKLDKVVRKNILWILGKFKDKRATPALLAALSEDEEKFGNTVVEALIEIRDPRAFDALAKMVRDPEGFYRWNAAYALCLLDDPRVDEFLMPYAEKGDMEVMAGADQFFIKRGVERAIPALIDALNHIEPESTMPETLIASGRLELVEAAKDYRAKHPMAYLPEEGVIYPRWGEARK